MRTTMYSPRINAFKSLFVTFAPFFLALVILAGCDSSSGGDLPRPSTTATASQLATTTPTGSQASTRIDAPGGAYTNLKPAELKAMLDHKDFLLVDVHTPHEGQLPQTDGRIPYDQVEQN